MPNIASVLKTEITRVARKEVRVEIEALKKSSTQHRSAVAALRRQLDALQKEVRRMGKQVAKPKPASPSESTSTETPRRFSASRLAAHRTKLGVSAAVYGKLVGVGAQTVYNWEQGKSRPNADQVRQLAAARELPRKVLLERLGTAADM